MAEPIVWRYLRASKRKHALYVVDGKVGQVSMCGLTPTRYTDRWYPDDDDPDGPVVLELVTRCKRCRTWVDR
jgi:hypothetical protein